ncbi:ion transporter [Halomonas dongshanensis]|uniref:Ion transporter n=1 Tax=Halomonas dongshanensis TaxID=2890835 RepID=A0ABT2EH90_9GAMM|nr:ion transporter [Halomonas dongshanensis]MCS2610966.1 ion transporter [Halomonas dongshanensis]
MLEEREGFLPRRQRPRLPRGIEIVHVGWDLLILLAVMANLTLIVFDTLYLIPPFNDAFAALAPTLQADYERVIHQRFLAIDLAFVTLFAVDVLIGWAAAIIERRYHRWFFYPFIHWYDVLGCIPLAGFRWLRALRVVSLLHRLHNLKLIDVTRWSAYRFVAKYYDILLEELSDRIALRLLGNVQQQVGASDSLTEQVVERVIMPRKQQLIHEIVQRVEQTAGRAYQQNREAAMAHISDVIVRTLRESPELRRLERLPMGNAVTQALEASLSDTARRLVDELALGIHTPAFRQLVERTAESGFDTWLNVDEGSHQVTEAIIIDALEMLKDHVRRQRWKERYE